MCLFSLSRAIEGFVVPWVQLEWPLDWNRVFDREAPLGLELGFGNGAFLVAKARENPAINWVGVEVSWVSVQRLLRRLDREGIANVRIVLGDGAYLLEHLFGPGAVREVFINHPDPWPKKRHHGRRLIHPRFVRILASRLEHGGQVTVATDHADYAGWIAEVLEGQEHLESAFPHPRVHSLPRRTPTKYERRGVEAGSAIHYFVWRKVRDPENSVPRRESSVPMPNVVLEGPLRGDPLTGFTPRTWSGQHRDTPVHVRLLGVYQSRPEREWLVESIVKEGGFTQHFMLSVAPRSPSRLLVKPSPIGYPRPTWGVKRAVGELAALILSLQDGLRVHSSTVGQVGPPPPA